MDTPTKHKKTIKNSMAQNLMVIKLNTPQAPQNEHFKKLNILKNFRDYFKFIVIGVASKIRSPKRERNCCIKNYILEVVL